MTTIFLSWLQVILDIHLEVRKIDLDNHWAVFVKIWLNLRRFGLIFQSQEKKEKKINLINYFKRLKYPKIILDLKELYLEVKL